MSTIRNLRAMKSDLSGTEESLLESGGSLHVCNVSDGYHLANIGTVILKTGPGVLSRVVVNSPVADSVIDLYDGTDLLASIVVPAVPTVLMPFALEYNMAFSTFLSVKMSSDVSDVTVIFK